MPLFGNGELEIEKSPRTPVQIEEKRRGGKAQEVAVPVAQARWSAFAAAAIVGAFIFAIVSFGALVFFGVTFVFGLTTFLWFHWRAIQGDDIYLEQVAVGIALALFLGFLAWCLWQVMDFVAPEFQLPLWAQKVQAVVSLLLLVFSIMFFIHLEPAFIQELLQRSPFQEQYIWQALGAILEFRYKRPRPARPPIHIYDRGRRVDGGNGQRVAEQWLDEIVAGDDGLRESLDVMEFLVRGQRLHDESGRLIKYRRRKWAGIQLTSGTIVTERQARGWAEKMSRAGILQDRGSGFDLAQGLTLADALDHLSISLDAPPPHPADLRAWSGEGYVPGPTTPVPPVPPRGEELEQ